MNTPNGNGNGHDGNSHDASGRDGPGVTTARANLPRTLPKPTVRPAGINRLPKLLVWLIPLAVAVAAGYYFLRLYHRIGPEITIRFPDGQGIQVGQTPLTVHGVRIGTVDAVDLAPDNNHADVHVRMQRDTGDIANAGTTFYLSRPSLAGGNIDGLSTLISGPYIVAVVGHGPPATTFAGGEGAPTMRGAGMRVILHATRLDHLGVDAPVYYRGVQVGVVQDVRLSDDSAGVNATVYVWLRYAKLVRTTTRFWPLASAEVKGGLLSGVQVELGSLRTLLGGGLALATPDAYTGSLAQDGTAFTLAEDGPRPEWLAWAPHIPLGPDTLGGAETGNGQQEEQGLLRSLVRVR